MIVPFVVALALAFDANDEATTLSGPSQPSVIAALPRSYATFANAAQPPPRRSPAAPPAGSMRGGSAAPQRPTPPTEPSEPLLRRGATGELAPPGQFWISGWIDASYTASSDRASNLPMGFNYRANQFLLQQNWIRIERAVRTDDATGPSFGFLSDTILPGSDYRFTLPRGLFNQQLVGTRGGPNLYGIDPVRFYAEGYFPNVAQGLDVKVGRFYAPWGIESVGAPSNTFLSHTYTFVYDPFTQTGILATVKLNDRWSTQSAVVIGNDEWFNPGNQPKYSGNIQWSAEDQRNSLRFSTILGSPRYIARYQLDNLNLFELIYSHQFSADVKYVFATTFGYQTGVPTLGTADWIGYQNYLTKRLNSKLTAAARVELFDDYKGQRTGFAGLYTDATIGIQAQLTERIRVRPELRLDDNTRSRPFEGKHVLFTAATDVIIRW